ncbi:MAG: bifunctional riboflavin kinase/FAD synthetase [Chromatiales bacterium]|nr:bifunctional riboflavin kinase/FAD synthetase [Chromatiales bacterium]
MDIIRGLHNLRPRHRGCALTIGNFDGVHLGHRAVLARLADHARRLAVPGALLVFEPHPREFFSAAHAPARLTRLREKLSALATTGVERVIVARFDAALSSQPPAEFIEDLLVGRLGVRFVQVGDDFRFGYRAEGTFTLLAEAGVRLGFETERHPTFVVQGARASSSRVRDALAGGDLDTAAAILGRPYSICGRVRRGRQLGRTIGFPTANVALARVATPISGVFAVRLHERDGTARPGVANVGVRPTVDGTVPLLEVHLFDYEGDLYGREVRVEFIRRLREERKFDGIDALRAQLARDATAAREALGVAGSASGGDAGAGG